MEPDSTHTHESDVSFDGGDLDCGNGLLLLIRRHIDPLEDGKLLEIRSTENSVEEDLPAWCRLTGNELVSWTREGAQRSYLVSKGAYRAGSSSRASSAPVSATTARLGRSMRSEVVPPTSLPPPSLAPTIEPLSVLGVGSWPRPRWMLRAIHDHVAGKITEEEFQETADDAVRLCVEAQLRAGVQVVSDGEQRRDSYASFVGGLLDNTQLIPLADLAAMVDEPAKFAAELRALDVPALQVRHPVPFGRLGRSRPLAVHEAQFVRGITDRPIKVALPGPYLLTRTMWLDCLTDNAYASREELAQDVVRVLREELAHLLAAGVSLVQFDEPVLTEVVFTPPTAQRRFMCGALSEKGEIAAELEFAAGLIDAVLEGAPRERTALHVCRGNWTKDETALLSGGYEPLVPLLREVRAGTLFLELSTPRAGEVRALAGLESIHRIGVGVVNPRSDRIESVDEILRRATLAIDVFGKERILLNPDCGFATFADNPVASARIAEAKLAAMTQAAAILRRS